VKKNKLLFVKTSTLPLKKQICIHKFERNLYIVLSIFLAVIMIRGILLLDSVNGYPTISLHKDREILETLNTTVLLGTVGTYRGSINHITISLQSSNTTQTLYHEYGHYIYDKLLNSSMRAYWVDVCCNKEYVFEGYKMSLTCKEQFTRSFTDYLDYGMWTLNMDIFTFHPEFFYNKNATKEIYMFLNQTYNQYIEK